MQINIADKTMKVGDTIPVVIMVKPIQIIIK
jgi:hypothetical protein